MGIGPAFGRGLEAATVALFRLAPVIRRPFLVAVLRMYQALFQYVNFTAGIALGRSPKLAFPWGMQSFFVPRVGAGSRVLDIGCGWGHLTEAIAGRAGLVVAYDADPSVVTAAHARRPRNVHYFCGDALDALPRASFDTVVLSSVLPFVSDATELLRRLRDLTPELLIRETRYDRDFTVLLQRSLGHEHRSDARALREYTKDALVAELERTGWRVAESVETYDMFIRAVRDEWEAP